MKILIADDDATGRHVLKAALQKLGYEVEAAADGEEAWAALQRPDAADLAILDWQMPGLTGPEICMKMRGREDKKYVYVILLTGMTDLSALVQGLESGADDFIAKPFRVPEIYARLRAGQRIVELQNELLAGRAQIEHLAAHDGLTGLWNRRTLMERLAQEWSRCRREKSSLGIILLDIDHFKEVNDRYGHLNGDRVLQEIARRLIDNIRLYDGAGRFGGEEFLVYAANCDMDQTFGFAERLRQTIHGAPMILSDGMALQVSASFGVSCAEGGDARDVQALIEAADRALYRAKNSGRNRVEGARDIQGSRTLRPEPVEMPQ